MHDRQRQPRGDVLVEALRLQHGRAPLVAEDLVLGAKTEVFELVGGQSLVRHRGFAQVGERVGTSMLTRAAARGTRGIR